MGGDWPQGGPERAGESLQEVGDPVAVPAPPGGGGRPHHPVSVSPTSEASLFFEDLYLLSGWLPRRPPHLERSLALLLPMGDLGP